MKRIRRMSTGTVGCQFDAADYSKTMSEPCLSGLCEEIISENEKRIEFEGDGPLGILFVEDKSSIIVSGITPKTVASEEYDLVIGMKLLKINSLRCSDISFSDNLKVLGTHWNKFSRLTLSFEKIKGPLSSTRPGPPKGSPLEWEKQFIEGMTRRKNCELYGFLEENDCERYFTSFEGLGVRNREDLEFVEYQDLINMKMDTEERKRISHSLKLSGNGVSLGVSPVTFEGLNDYIPEIYEGLVHDDV